MKQFSASIMRQQARIKNRKVYRRQVISNYRQIINTIRQAAKNGYHHIEFRNLYIPTHLERVYAFRLFAFKHPDFKIKWEVDYEGWTGKDKVIAYHCPFENGIGYITINIKW